jgi:hypothetical protein
MNHMTVIRVFLAVAVTAGYFGAFWTILEHSDRFKDTQLLIVLVSAISTAFGALMQWSFGSSVGSDRKTELLARAPAIQDDK